MNLLGLSFACGTFLLLAPGAEASITVTASDFYVHAREGSSLNPSTHYSSTAIPSLAIVSAVEGGSTNDSTIDWHAIGNRTTLSLDLSHLRGGAQYSFAETDFNVFFTANSNEPYDASGYYNTSDLGPSGTDQLFTYLFDLTASQELFFSLQNSQSTLDEQFTLGQAGGDTDNILSGSLAGNLISGHDYVFAGFGYTQAYPDADSGASALGNITLRIDEVEETAATPEPFSLMVWVGLIAATVMGSGRRTRNYSISGNDWLLAKKGVRNTVQI